MQMCATQAFIALYLTPKKRRECVGFSKKGNSKKEVIQTENHDFQKN